MYTIEQFTVKDADYDEKMGVWCDIYNGLHPEHAPRTVKGQRHFDSAMPDGAFNDRSLILRDGAVVGCGNVHEHFWSATPNMFVAEAFVKHEAQRQGAGAAWEAYARERLAARGAQSIMTYTHEDEAGAIAFLEKRGFEAVQRNLMSRLVLEGFDFGRFPQTTPPGITITTFRELRENDPDWLQKSIRLATVSGEDMPRTEPRGEITEAMMLGWVNDPSAAPDGDFHAIDSETGEWVGISNLYFNKETPERIVVGYTGVIPSHRRRGIATALKLKTIAYAISVGGKSIDTDNAETNPMYVINERLGFRPMPAQIEYKKVLTPTEG